MVQKAIKVGTKVTWVCQPAKKYAVRSFTCSGVVVATHKAVFGGKLEKLGARVEVTTKKWRSMFPARKGKTFLAANRLTIAA